MPLPIAIQFMSLKSIVLFQVVVTKTLTYTDW